MNTTEFLDIASSIVPHRIAIIFEGHKLTFQQIQKRVDSLTNALGDLGVKAGDRVAMMNLNTPEVIETYLACAKMDAIFVPFNYRAKKAEFSHMIGISEPTVLFVGKRYENLVQSIIGNTTPPNYVVAVGQTSYPQWLSYNNLIESFSQEDIPIPSADDMDTTLLLFTAGTTGTPKAVMLSHNSFSSYMLSNVTPADPDIEEKNLLSVPMYHIAGIQGALAAIFGGRTLIIMRQFDALEWLKLVQNEGADRAAVVPTMLKQIMDHPKFREFDVSTLKTITYGAEPMPLGVIKRAIASFPSTRFINAFGQTETASTITMLTPDDHILEGDPSEIEVKLRRLTSIGQPLGDIEVSIVDEDGKEMPPEHVGEIATRGHRIMKGYWRDAKSTKDAIRGDWLYTGDLGYKDEDGYIYLAGRSKDFIKRGGEMISPEEVEQILMSHPYVDDAAIIGVPDIEWGERVRAIIVAVKGTSTNSEELIEYCHSRLASFKKPESIVFVNELPRNALGKVLKRILREKYSNPIHP